MELLTCDLKKKCIKRNNCKHKRSRQPRLGANPTIYGGSSGCAPIIHPRVAPLWVDQRELNQAEHVAWKRHSSKPGWPLALGSLHEANVGVSGENGPVGLYVYLVWPCTSGLFFTSQHPIQMFFLFFFFDGQNWVLFAEVMLRYSTCPPAQLNVCWLCNRLKRNRSQVGFCHHMWH